MMENQLEKRTYNEVDAGSCRVHRVAIKKTYHEAGEV